MVTVRQHVGTRPGQANPDGHTAAEPLGQGDDVRHDVVTLEGIEMTRPANPRLHLVEYQQQVLVVAPLSDRRQVLLGGRNDAGLTLHRLQEHCDSALVGGLLEGGDVVVFDVAKPRGHGKERLLVFGLTRGRDGGQGTAVKGLVGGDDVKGPVAVLLAPLAGYLEGAFVGLGAAVGVEDPSLEPEFVEALGQLDLGAAVIEVADVDRFPGLARHRLDQGGMVVTQNVDGNAGDEVQILAAVRVVDVPAVGADQLQWLALEGLHQVFLLGLGQRAEAGSDGVGHPGTIMVPMPSVVSSSSRSAWGTRPSMMCAFSTPASARTQALTLGIMPPVTVPSSIFPVTSWATISAINAPLSSLMPSTSVSKISLRAPSATASSAATVSAFTLYDLPS